MYSGNFGKAERFGLRKISENLRWRLNYENNEVLVGTHIVSAYSSEQASIVMFFATLKGYG